MYYFYEWTAFVCLQHCLFIYEESPYKLNFDSWEIDLRCELELGD